MEFENPIQFFSLAFCVCLISREEGNGSSGSVIMDEESSLTG